MKRLLLLGGSKQQIIAIKTAKHMGIYTILCDYLPDNPGQYYADKFYLVSTTDKDAVLKVAIHEKINGVIAYASDPAAPTAAYVAETLGLPTNPYKSVNLLCNKYLFRAFLKSHGFNVPFSQGYTDKTTALKNIEKMTFPIIVKPVDSSGSKGIRILFSLDDAENAIDFAFSYSRCKKIIIEEYIQIKHPFLIGGDIFVIDGKVIQWGLMNCHRDIRVNPVVPAGKSYPLVLEQSDLDAVKETLQQIVSSLNIQNGPMNVELLIDKNDCIFPIDIGPRSGGNMIPDLLSLIYKCDLADMSIRCVMGEDLLQDYHDYAQENEYFASYNLHSSREGILKQIIYSSVIEKYIIRKSMFKKPGDDVHYFSNSADAIGIVFLKFPDQETMIEMEEHMNDYIKIVLQGESL